MRWLKDIMNSDMSKVWELVMEKEAWRAAVHGVAKILDATELNLFSFISVS